MIHTTCTAGYFPSLSCEMLCLRPRNKLRSAPIQKDFRGLPKLGDPPKDDIPHPAQLGPGHVDAGSHLGQVAHTFFPRELVTQ